MAAALPHISTSDAISTGLAALPPTLDSRNSVLRFFVPGSGRLSVSASHEDNLGLTVRVPVGIVNATSTWHPPHRCSE
ncbi:hypothetical protein ACIO7M_13365 [Streptomyces toxytricini]|uniref:Uncharacterized protein n=1 Tax=Streptomyces toxytricini TaxID=67369 RepID=A0ABW8EFR8_STRT5